MKKLILRDIYLIRKNLLITFGIFAGVFLLGLMAVLSAKYGNIAKYAFDNEVIDDVLETTTAFAIVGGVVLGTAVEHVYNLINKDYKCGWHEYLKASGIRPAALVGVKYLLVIFVYIICLLTGIGGCQLLKALSGSSQGLLFTGAFARQEGMIILVWFSSAILILGGYFSTLEYSYKGRNNTKTDLIKVLPVIVLIIIGMIVFSALEQNEDARKMLLNKIFELAQNDTVLYVIPIVTSIVVTVISYLNSVRIVRKEGKRV